MVRGGRKDMKFYLNQGGFFHEDLVISFGEGREGGGVYIGPGLYNAEIEVEVLDEAMVGFVRQRGGGPGSIYEPRREAWTGTTWAHVPTSCDGVGGIASVYTKNTPAPEFDRERLHAALTAVVQEAIVAMRGDDNSPHGKEFRGETPTPIGPILWLVRRAYIAIRQGENTAGEKFLQRIGLCL